jgi:hypothetical protein
MSISTLTSLASNYFRGFSHLTRNGDDGLKAIINTIIAKVNEILTATEFDTLTVGDPTGYYLTGHAWMIIDGYNPPTFSKIRVQDQVTGIFYDCAPESGTWTCNEVT